MDREPSALVIHRLDGQVVAKQLCRSLKRKFRHELLGIRDAIRGRYPQSISNSRTISRTGSLR